MERKFGGERLQEFLRTLQRQGADGKDLAEGELLRIPFDHRQENGFCNQVHLVENAVGRFPRLPHAFENGLLFRLPSPITAGRIDHHEDQVRVGDGRLGRLHHGALKGVPRLQESGRIEKDRLEVGRGKNTEDAVARRLCLPGDDRDLLPEKAVHQRRFSNVRLANDGDIAAAESVFHCHHFTDAREIRVPTLPILRCGRE